MWTYNYNYELYHYGVKGMKWGVRRAEKYSSKAGSLRTRADEFEAKGNAKKAASLRKKADKFTEKSAAEKRLVEFKKESNKVRDKRTFGEKVVTYLLGGPFANQTYNAARAAGAPKAGATSAVIVGGILGGPVGQLTMTKLYERGAKKNTLVKKY